MKTLRNFLILGVIGWLIWSAISQQGPGDRPPVVISNGPVRIEAQPDRQGAGDFQKGMMGIGRSWYHHHPAHGPSRFEVVVADSSCGPDAKYDATEVVVMSGGNGASSTITISVGGLGPVTYLAVEPDLGTTISGVPSSRNRVDIGNRDDQLQTVRIGPATCSFSPGQGSITIIQHK